MLVPSQNDAGNEQLNRREERSDNSFNRQPGSLRLSADSIRAKIRGLSCRNVDSIDILFVNRTYEFTTKRASAVHASTTAKLQRRLLTASIN
jgi:hypothetical protein